MAASSVTGVGPGMSNGLQKSENHCGCNCGGTPTELEATPVVKRGCVTNYVAKKATSYVSSGSSTSIKVC